MKYYVQFEETRKDKWNDKTRGFEDCTPYQVDAIGSDGVYILDGRNSLNTMIQDAKDRAKLINLLCHFTGFKIVRGSRFSDNNTVLYRGTI